MAFVDTTSLFLHVLAAIGLVGGGLVQVLAGVRVRAAATGRELATWAGFARGAGLLMLAPVGPMLGGARLRQLTEAAGPVGDGPLPADLRSAASAPGLWGPIHSLVGVGVGLVALMVYKPDWLPGAILLVVTFAAGWLVGVVLARRTGTGHAAA